MIAVIFEVEPDGADGKARYLELAAALAPQLERLDGFISLERFQSLSDPGKFLSLSFFRDEAAVAAWRNTPQHRAAQSAGRREIFSAYRLRIAHVVRNYTLKERDDAPTDSDLAHGLRT